MRRFRRFLIIRHAQAEELPVSVVSCPACSQSVANSACPEPARRRLRSTRTTGRRIGPMESARSSPFRASVQAVVHRGYDTAGGTRFFGLAGDNHLPVEDWTPSGWQETPFVASAAHEMFPRTSRDGQRLHASSPPADRRPSVVYAHGLASDLRTHETERFPSAVDHSAWPAFSTHCGNGAADPGQAFIPCTRGDYLPLPCPQAIPMPCSQSPHGKCFSHRPALGGACSPSSALTASPFLARLLLCILTSRTDGSRISALLKLEAQVASLLHDTRRLHMTLTVLDAVLCNAVPIAVVALNSPHVRRTSAESAFVSAASAVGGPTVSSRPRPSGVAESHRDAPRGSRHHQPNTLGQSTDPSRKSSSSASFRHQDGTPVRVRWQGEEQGRQGRARKCSACHTRISTGGAAQVWDTVQPADGSLEDDCDESSSVQGTAALGVSYRGDTTQTQQASALDSGFPSRPVSAFRDSDSLVTESRGTVAIEDGGEDSFQGRALSLPEDEGGGLGDFPGRCGVSAMVQIDFSNEGFFSGGVPSSYASGSLREQVSAKGGRVRHAKQTDREVQAIRQMGSAASGSSAVLTLPDRAAASAASEDCPKFLGASANSCTQTSRGGSAHPVRGDGTEERRLSGFFQTNPASASNFPCLLDPAATDRYATGSCNAAHAAVADASVSSFSGGHAFVKGDAASPELSDHSASARTRCARPNRVSNDSVQGARVSDNLLSAGECGAGRHFVGEVCLHSEHHPCDPEELRGESRNSAVGGGGFLPSRNARNLPSTPTRPSLVVGQPFSAVSRLVCMQVYTSVCICLDLVLVAPQWVERLVGLLHAIIRRSSVHEDAVFRSFACDCLQELEKSCPGEEEAQSSASRDRVTCIRVTCRYSRAGSRPVQRCRTPAFAMPNPRHGMAPGSGLGIWRVAAARLFLRALVAAVLRCLIGLLL